MIDTNVKGLLYVTRAVVPGMVERGRGAIVNVSSLLAFSGDMPSLQGLGRAVYASTKSYLVAFSRILAGELGPESPVRVQVVCPGITATEFHLTQGDRSVEGDTPLAEGGGMPALAPVIKTIVPLSFMRLS